jgi:hypothetical protein
MKIVLTTNSATATLLQLNFSSINLQTYLIFECLESEGKLICLKNYRRQCVFDTPVSSSPKMFTCCAEYQILLIRNV